MAGGKSADSRLSAVFLRDCTDSSFVLDSLVVLRDGKKEGVLHEGDHLPTNMENVVLKAYFGKANKTPIEIVDKNFAQSGNAVRMGFKTRKMSASCTLSGRRRVLVAHRRRSLSHPICRQLRVASRLIACLVLIPRGMISVLTALKFRRLKT